MTRDEKLNNYEAFVEKFKPKKTTDDCYTPPAVYEVIKEWVVNEYNLKDINIYRPFYPGGDYERFNYEGGVVIDNPPFSILSKIIDFYNKNNIKYFLFAPHFTLFSANRGGYVVVDARIVYENGANVNTSFLTNMDKSFIRTAPDLKRKIKEAQGGEEIKQLRYKYPINVLTSTRINTDIDARIDKKDCYFIRELDCQKERKKTIFGAGYLVSDKYAKYIKPFRGYDYDYDYEWELSEREQEIIKNLG